MSDYCKRHGTKHRLLKSGGLSNSHGCPRCAAERHREQAAAARQESEYRRANPGDYECPQCLYNTLKRGASRCPSCHSDVPDGHWERVQVAQKAAAERWRAREEAESADWEREKPAWVAANLRKKIAKERDEFVNGLRFAGLATAIEVGLILAWALCRYVQSKSTGLVELFSSLGLLVFLLAALIGAVIVAGIVLVQLRNTVLHLSKSRRV